jgi:hypothetical protein
MNGRQGRWHVPQLVWSEPAVSCSAAHGACGMQTLRGVQTLRPVDVGNLKAGA